MTWSDPLAAVAVLAACASPDLPATFEAQMQPLLFPAGLASPGGTMAFLDGAAGGFEAIDLATGERRWQRAAPSQPLIAVAEDLWIVDPEAGGVRFSRLDAGTGERRGPPSRRFEWPLETGRIEVEGWLPGSGLVLRWTSFPGESGEQLPAELDETREGRILVDPEASGYRRWDRPPASPARPSAPPRRPAGELLADVAGSRGPWGTGHRAAVVLRPSDDPEALWVVAWSPPDETTVERFELIRPYVPWATMFSATTDGGHLAAFAGGEAEGAGRLRVVSIASGEAVAEVAVEGALDFRVSVLGGRVFVAEEPFGEPGEHRLRAFEAGSSRRLWQLSRATEVDLEAAAQEAP